MAPTKKTAKKTPLRRRPVQRRSRETVGAVLDAVAKILKREGVGAVTTNRIAAVAGVSIGSVYQYFPDKRAIFAALLERHIDDIGQVVDRTLATHAASPVEDMVGALVRAMVEAHEKDPELHELLTTEVPHRGEAGFQARIEGALHRALSNRARSLKRPHDVDKIVFVLTHMMEAVTHGAVLRRPARVSLAAAKEEAVRAVLAYLKA